MLAPMVRVLSVGISAVGVSVATAVPPNHSGTDFVGIAAIITSIVGAVGLVWSIWQGQRSKSTEIDDALKIFREFEKQRRESEGGKDDNRKR